MHFRDHLLDDELEELPHLIDDASVQLFGITQRDTFYWALPEPVRGRYGRADWEARFDILENTLVIRMHTGARLSSTFAANKAADCIASRCSGGNWFAPSMASIREAATAFMDSTVSQAA